MDGPAIVLSQLCSGRGRHFRRPLIAIALALGLSLPVGLSPAGADAPVSTIDSTSVSGVALWIDVEVSGDLLGIGNPALEGHSQVNRYNPIDGYLETVISSSSCASQGGDGFPPFTGTHCWMIAIAAGLDGEVYVRSWTDARIWKITANGTESVFAGNGTGGYNGDGGPATAASILGDDGSPLVFDGMDVGPDGSLYFAERFLIRRVDPAGIITTVAGTGAEGHAGDGGPATEATLGAIESIAVDPDGTLFIATGANDSDRVRRVDLDGTITTYLGTGEKGFSGDEGPSHLARVGNIHHIATDAIGGLYVSDDGRIRYIDPTGVIDTIAGNGTHGYAGDGGPAIDAVIADRSTSDLAIDHASGSLYLNNRTIDKSAVRVITRRGSLAGTVTDHGVADAEVSVLDADSDLEVASTSTTADGSYWVDLAPGIYEVYFDGSAAGLVSEYWNNTTDPNTATTVVVEPAVETTADAQLGYETTCTGEPGVGPFSDVGSEHLFCSPIEWLTQAGIADGYPDGTFQPTRPLARQAAAALLRAAFDDGTFEPPTEATFTDVPTDHPFYADIEWLHAAGYASGYADGSFDPTRPLTRQAAAAMLRPALDDSEFTAPAEATFSDVAVDHPFFVDIEWLHAAGLANGYADGTFDPTRALTRQSAAALLTNALADP